MSQVEPPPVQGALRSLLDSTSSPGGQGPVGSDSWEGSDPPALLRCPLA